jgi:hypothetical protein
VREKVSSKEPSHARIPYVPHKGYYVYECEPPSQHALAVPQVILQKFQSLEKNHSNTKQDGVNKNNTLEIFIIIAGCEYMLLGLPCTPNTKVNLRPLKPLQDIWSDYAKRDGCLEVMIDRVRDSRLRRFRGSVADLKPQSVAELRSCPSSAAADTGVIS